MRPVSDKRRKRNAEAKPFRENLIKTVGQCEICGHSPQHKWKDKPADCSQLCVHEIANGPDRNKALDKPFATLVLCWWCNGQEVTSKADWPESRQLAVLARSRPMDFDLSAYLKLTNPNAMKRIEIHEVLSWMSEEYLSKQDVASMVQVDRRAVQNWIDSGELLAMDARTVGSTRPLWRIAWSDYLDFCERRSTR